MRIYYYAAAVILASIPQAIADALADFASLKTLVVTTANQLASSLTVPINSNSTNSTSRTFALPVGASFPTVGKLQNLTTSVEASNASCGADPTSFKNGNNVTVLDSAYMDYINQIPSLSQALVARGRAWHPELNQPVYSAIGDLATAIYAYGTELTQAGVIGEDSTIRTITAGGTLTDAEGAWDNTGTLPGKRSSYVA